MAYGKQLESLCCLQTIFKSSIKREYPTVLTGSVFDTQVLLTSLIQPFPSPMPRFVPSRSIQPGPKRKKLWHLKRHFSLSQDSMRNLPSFVCQHRRNDTQHNLVNTGTGRHRYSTRVLALTDPSYPWPSSISLPRGSAMHIL